MPPSVQRINPRPGQRWISDVDSRLGLGTVTAADPRRMTLHFPASDETRTYAIESAPLTRVVFSKGDRIRCAAGWTLTIENVKEEDGVLYYSGVREDTGESAVLPETALHEQMQFASPRERLFAGLLDGSRWYALRQTVLEHRARILGSPVRGLLGARAALLPHQLQVAVEGMRRLQPRLLLADEVGLGKTIEAGLLIHAQRVNNQVERVLILVPPPLLHQWLVEMRRRFNFTPAIIDSERFDEALASAPDGNPFLSEQLVLSTLDALLADERMALAVKQAGWDMLVVDEAHHLEWHPDAPSAEWSLARELAESIPSVLLLTATPEQLGQDGHYARLHLLDPERFPSWEAFVAEQQDYREVTPVANKLYAAESLEESEIEQLQGWLGESFDSAQRELLRSGGAMAASGLAETLLDELVDRHGTGRLLFRNTRQSVAGFPERELHTHELDADESVLEWLLVFMASRAPEKILLICHSADTVKQLGAELQQSGLNVALFHEQMSILERDRAAAWFADEEENCRLLLCSEIGSEGRNFQFVHTLVTFELPERPDLLEQRIGRLDRIGQTDTIEVHVPYIPGSRDHLLLRFHHQGLDAFRQHLSTGAAMYAEFEELLNVMIAETPLNEAAFDNFLERVRERHSEVKASFENGRDRLLELHSNRPERIQAELDDLARFERDYSLSDFMNRVFDQFGVEVEDQIGHWIIRPGDNMRIEHFPYLREDGMRVSFDREVALAREEIEFLSWDHPMVQGALDLVLSEGLGQADAMVIQMPDMATNMTFVETTWSAECQAPAALSMPRWLHAANASFIVGIDGRDYSTQYNSAEFDAAQMRFDRSKLKQVIVQNRKPLSLLIDRAEALAEAALPEQIAAAREDMLAYYNGEIERLEALARINPSVSSTETRRLIERRDASLAALDEVRPHLAAVRVLINQ